MKRENSLDLYSINIYIFMITLFLLTTRTLVSYKFLKMSAILINISEFLIPIFVGLFLRAVLIIIYKQNLKLLSKWRHTHLINHSINILSILVIFLGLSTSFRNNLFFIDSSIILISVVLLYFLWILFSNKSELNNIFKGYFSSFNLRGKGIKLLLVDIKILIFVSLIKLFLEILINTLSVNDINMHFEDYFSYLLFFLNFIIILFTSLVIRKILDLFLLNFGRKVKKSENEIVKNYLFILPLASNLIRIFSFIVFIVLFLNLLGYTTNNFISNIPSLVQSISIFAAGLSFAARDIISNFLSGILILTDSPFNIGDRIEVGKVYGDVEEIGIRTTKIKTLENSIITVPNAMFTTQSVKSYRKYNTFTKIRYTISVSIKEDVDNIKELLYQSLNSCDDILKVPSYRVYVTSYDSFKVNMLVIFWIRDISKELISKDNFNTSILKSFRDNKIEVIDCSFKELIASKI